MRPEVNTALFADNLCIWTKKRTVLQLTKTLQKDIDQTSIFCKKWGFSINKTKINYITFTPAYQVKISLDSNLKLRFSTVI
jgi:hypothetical protein